MQLGTGRLRAPQNSDILGTSFLSRSLQKQMTHRTNNQSFQKTAGITLLMTPLHFLSFHKGWSRPPAPPAAFVPLGEGQNPLTWGNVGQGSPHWVNPSGWQRGTLHLISTVLSSALLSSV